MSTPIEINILEEKQGFPCDKTRRRGRSNEGQNALLKCTQQSHPRVQGFVEETISLTRGKSFRRYECQVLSLTKINWNKRHFLLGNLIIDGRFAREIVLCTGLYVKYIRAIDLELELFLRK